MEEILRKLQKEASGNKHKAIKESCGWAIETLESSDAAATKIPPYKLREKCLLPLQLALESKNVKLAQHALAGMQKLLSDERFVSVETGSDEKQLLNQVLNAIKVTPSLNEDLQVEVMKSLVAEDQQLLARCPAPKAVPPPAAAQYQTMPPLLLRCCWQVLCLQRWAPSQQPPPSSCPALKIAPATAAQNQSLREIANLYTFMGDNAAHFLITVSSESENRRSHGTVVAGVTRYLHARWLKIHVPLHASAIIPEGMLHADDAR
ncbi:Brefeldin A-inhibited guanine nucleotide-exchange protein 3 [Chelonia mydas]|uniref:Brefeldin A-inhibited guanine nucleotide-exchange protein 3 n=1 Tax=Chelonia mydas TaxID=8469 RepID=M7BJQ2_CHEMY|nr:Brefeldin A-inhibited guanine nucleotide-exchange protein 3 [Chelonia mydas]